MSERAYLYFPGCTLSTSARRLDETGRAVAAALGAPLRELADWTCCGATFPLALDNLMALAGPARILADARRCGAELVTLCAGCYNVLGRTNVTLGAEPDRLRILNEFNESRYAGDLRVLHYLELLRDEVGLDALADRAVRPLHGLRAAPYYGCLLLRPADVAVDDPDRPTVLEAVLSSVGCEVVDYPMRSECCGSYQVVRSADASVECSARVLRSAAGAGAECLVTACPLCHFNLTAALEAIGRSDPDVADLAILYFTELLAWGLGLEAPPPALAWTRR